MLAYRRVLVLLQVKKKIMYDISTLLGPSTIVTPIYDSSGGQYVYKLLFRTLEIMKQYTRNVVKQILQQIYITSRISNALLNSIELHVYLQNKVFTDMSAIIIYLQLKSNSKMKNTTQSELFQNPFEQRQNRYPLIKMRKTKRLNSEKLAL